MTEAMAHAGARCPAPPHSPDELLQDAATHRNAAQIAPFADDLRAAREHLRKALTAERAADEIESSC